MVASVWVFVAYVNSFVSTENQKEKKKRFHLYNLALENLIVSAESQREKNN
jgi:hypothetical protein